MEDHVYFGYDIHEVVVSATIDGKVVQAELFQNLDQAQQGLPVVKKLVETVIETPSAEVVTEVLKAGKEEIMKAGKEEIMKVAQDEITVEVAQEAVKQTVAHSPSFIEFAAQNSVYIMAGVVVVSAITYLSYQLYCMYYPPLPIDPVIVPTEKVVSPVVSTPEVSSTIVDKISTKVVEKVSEQAMNTTPPQRIWPRVEEPIYDILEDSINNLGQTISNWFDYNGLNPSLESPVEMIFQAVNEKNMIYHNIVTYIHELSLINSGQIICSAAFIGLFVYCVYLYKLSQRQ